MSEEEREDAEQTGTPQVTTQENALGEKPAGEWQMPEPVYRKTSGYLPQGFENQFPQGTPQAAAASPSPAPLPAVAAAAPAADVEPQPDIIEVLAAEPPLAPVTVQAGRSTLSIVLIVLGLIAMGVIIVGFLVIVYYLFLAEPAQTSF